MNAWTPITHPVSVLRPGFAAAMALLTVLAGGSLSPLRAEPAWTEAHNARARLIPGGPASPQGNMLAGIQIQMEPGWKTYWRNPGDAGVPPRFDWSASSNVRKTRVLWPAPKRFSDPTGTYIGYENEVIFPVEIQAEKPGQPVKLDLQIEYAVCKDICIPVESRLRVELGGSSADMALSALVARYLKHVPRKTSQAGGAQIFRRIEAELSGGKPRLSVDVVSPAEGKSDLFVEPPEGVYLPMAESAGRQPDGSQRFTVDLAQAGDPAGLKGKLFRFTLNAGGAAYETEWRVK